MAVAAGTVFGESHKSSMHDDNDDRMHKSDRDDDNDDGMRKSSKYDDDDGRRH